LAWHGLKSVPKVPWQMLKTMGPGYLSSRIFDRTMGIWFKPDHPLRKYGSFVSFFLPDILRMSIGSARIAASPVLSRAGGFFSRAGNRVLLVAISDFAFGKLFVDNDYQGSIHKRVADKVYDQHVYKLNGWDLLVLPAALKLVRAGARELAPNAIDWSVTVDNPDLKSQVVAEDLKNSREITKFLQEGFAKLLLNPGAFDLSDPKSYKEIDFSLLGKPVELTDTEKRVLKALQDCNQPESEKELQFLPEAEMESVLQRVYLYQLQQGVKFLQAVKQPENQWSESLFKPDGSLIEGGGERLLRIAVPSKKGEPSSEQKLLASRRLLVAINYLDGQSQFHGHDLAKLSKAAGIVDETGHLTLDDESIGALTLFAEQARQDEDGDLKEKLKQRSGELMSEYLTADEARKKRILLALNSMGVSTPDGIPQVSQ